MSLCGCVPFAVVVGLLSRVKAENGRRPRRQRAKVGRKEEEVVARLRIMAPLPLSTKKRALTRWILFYVLVVRETQACRRGS